MSVMKKNWDDIDIDEVIDAMLQIQMSIKYGSGYGKKILETVLSYIIDMNIVLYKNRCRYDTDVEV